MFGRVMLIGKVLDTITEYNLVEKGDGVVVGISGGPDSVCLLHVLHALSEQLGIKLYAVHINHMLRGSESDDDQRYVEKLCNQLGVPLYARAFDVKKVSLEKGISIEEAGREIRYGEFKRIAEYVNARKIAVAHNKNDQAETVLMHMLRGTGLDGLKGMNYKRDGIIRPLLGVPRKDIEEYCALYSLKPRIDRSNLENVYARNKVRLDLVPYINKLFETDITEILFKMSSLIRDDIDFIEKAVHAEYKDSMVMQKKGEIRLNIPKIRDKHPAMQKRIIRNAIKEIKGDLKGIESIHIESAVDMALRGNTGKLIHLPADIRIEKSYDQLKVYIKYTSGEFHIPCTPVTIPGVTEVGIKGSLIHASIINDKKYMENIDGLGYKSMIQFFDYEKLKSGINIRNRKDGDVFKPYRSNGTKKLKEYFIDNKIPRETRESMPIVAKDNEVVWIVGHKISDKFKVTDNTKSILRLEFKD